jgi:hypothetical protein
MEKWSEKAEEDGNWEGYLLTNLWTYPMHERTEQRIHTMRTIKTRERTVKCDSQEKLSNDTVG